MIKHDETAQTEARATRSGKLARIREVLAKRPDSEHEMTANRMVFATAVLFYLKFATFFGSVEAGEILAVVWPVFALYYVVSVLLFVHIVNYPESSPSRRVFAIFHDLGMISFTAAACGLAGGLMYPLFLWTIFGNGFRFGVKYLHIATAVSLVGFAGVIWHTSLAATHLGLTVSLVIGLIILPLYVSVLIRKLSTAKQQAEEANRAKSLFLASVSHELRTPLNAIIGLGGILRQRPREREEAEMVRTIERSGQSLLSLINSILNLSRIEAGRMPMQSTRFDLFALIADVRSMLSVQAKEKGLRLSTHVTARTPRFVTASKMNIEEILINLTANAVKFTKTGYVLIVVDCVEDDQGQARLKIDVIDTGVGIEKVAQKRIFESFTQADETVINEFGGSGLGLAICKQLVESQGGTIGVDSAKGGGSRFWLEMPIIEAEGAIDKNSGGEDSGGETSETVEQPTAQRVILATQDQHLLTRVLDVYPETLSVCDNHAAWLLLQGLSDNSEDAFVLVDERLDQSAELPGRLAGPGYDGVRFVLLREDEEAPLDRELQQRFHSATTRDFAPATLAHALAAAASHGVAHEEGAGLQEIRRLDGLDILVAEDNKTNQMVISKILESVGCRVRAVDDGEKALEAMASERFDVVLMDLNMPNMDGIEAAKLYAFTSLGENRIPIIALTADATDNTRKRCLDAGMIGFATKPIDTRELLDIISHAVSGSHAEKPLVAQTARPALDMSKSRILNPDTLRQLEKLGGASFVGEIVEQCRRDVEQLCTELEDCVARLDKPAFDDCLHALRSCAANAGAERVFALSLSWRDVREDQIAAQGDELIGKLRSEIAAFKAAYDEYATRENASAHPSTAYETPPRYSHVG
jgi:two-component system sensor histidine kinase RpfC